ncbi:MFS transporter [Actinomadura spongiicola]|uniref:MFS transporter n=1 Tax=Actinomadura spongiicola TaxID=2303421 RepID=A0A372GEB8_9ACTN|nr:MFS transporter [Actinomadura spongiicola]RFS83542.1 MFS transporter [Actinomadura spongiicola]
MGRRGPLIALATAQFVMVLDQSVMNVSISTLVDDFDTTVSAIQAVITLYCLVMAMFMLTGAKIGDIIGRRRAFVTGLVVYACGSALTAAAPTLAVLAVGWSVLEGAGAALVLPALVALVADNFTGRERAAAYAVIGGVAGAGIAVGPILGGWATTELTWRVIFVGEVVLVAFVLLMSRLLTEPARDRPAPRLDLVGTVLSACGIGTIVLGALQSSTWGWIRPKDAPVEPFGLSPTLFVVALGGALLWGFAAWQRRREHGAGDPLLHLDLLKSPPLRAGLIGLLSQNLILMGVFFVMPLYLQLVLGMNALDTGVRMLPVSIMMFVAAAVGSRLSSRFSVRAIVRTGLVLTGGAILALMATVRPDLAGAAFAISMGALGTGMGLMVSQLGNLVQSSVGSSGRAEAGGLQYTGQQLGSSLGIALIGAIVLAGLTGAFMSKVEQNDRVSAQVAQQVGVAAGTGVDFVSTDRIEAAARNAGLDEATTDALVDDYGEAQILSLKAGLVATALLVLGSLAFTRDLPRTVGASGPQSPAAEDAARPA